LTEVVIETTGTLQGGGWLAYIPRLKSLWVFPLA